MATRPEETGRQPDAEAEPAGVSAEAPAEGADDAPPPRPGSPEE